MFLRSSHPITLVSTKLSQLIKMTEKTRPTKSRSCQGDTSVAEKDIERCSHLLMVRNYIFCAIMFMLFCKHLLSVTVAPQVVSSVMFPVAFLGGELFP